MFFHYFFAMKTHSEISALLRARIQDQGLTQSTLRESAGIAQRTLTNVLSGEQDFKVSTLLALLDRLGLELVLVPNDAAPAAPAWQVAPSNIPTRVQVALERTRMATKDDHER